LSLTRVGGTPKPAVGYESSVGCLFALRTREGDGADLLVQATALKSPEQARQFYRARLRRPIYKPDGNIGGIGDEADALSLQEHEPGFKRSEYIVETRSGNLVVEVFLGMSGSQFKDKATLAAKTTAILKSTLAMVPMS